MERLLALSDEKKISIFDALITFLGEDFGEAEVDDNTPLPKKSEVRPSSGKFQSKQLSELKKEELVRFGKLKVWRNQVASALDIPAYMVFPNAVLVDLAVYVPSDNDELLRIRGIGKDKMGKYGQDLLDILAVNDESVDSPQVED
jgi:ATP-dependent DNA helicase RecQ